MSELYGILMREKRRLEGEVGDLTSRLTAKQASLDEVNTLLSNMGSPGTDDTASDTGDNTGTRTPDPNAKYPQVREGSGMWRTIQLLKQNPDGLSNQQLASALGYNYPYVRNITSALAHQYKVITKERHVTSDGPRELNIWVGV